MVSARKKRYMREYNQRPEVKSRKAAYMRKVRAEADQKAARDLVSFLLDMGYENMAFDVAQERAPEMLLTAKAKQQPQKRQNRK